jgi:hypothetical protein
MPKKSLRRFMHLDCTGRDLPDGVRTTSPVNDSREYTLKDD